MAKEHTIQVARTNISFLLRGSLSPNERTKQYATIRLILNRNNKGKIKVCNVCSYLYVKKCNYC